MTGMKRSPAAPGVPTIAETLPGYEVPVWSGFLVPATTPRAIVGRLNAEIKTALDTPAVSEKLASQGIDTHYTTEPEFATLIREDAARWAKLVKESGIVLE
jgi:tripartite-type tricarboxylate transporter receptor subunit TctC